jgi:regulator of replication initiation timing
MARTTKLEIQQHLNARTTECVQLRTENAELRATVSALREQLDARITKPVEGKPLSGYQQAAQKARELARKLGHSVKVGS